MYFKTQADLDNYLKRLKEPTKSKYWGIQIGPNGYSDDEVASEIQNEQTAQERREEVQKDVEKRDDNLTDLNSNEQTDVPDQNEEQQDSKDKKYYDTEGDFTWAKSSEIKNVGEEIDGAARHNRNKNREWSTINELVEARKENLSRKDLDELYPNNLKELISEEDDVFNNELLLCQLMLLSYPPKTPDEASAERYASLYVEIKELAEKSMQDRFGSKPSEIMYQALRDKLLTLIKMDRHENGGYDTEFSRAMRLYHNRILKGQKSSPFQISRDVDNQTIEGYLEDLTYDQKQQLKWVIHQKSRGQSVEITPEIEDAFIGLSKSISEGKKDFIRSGKPRVVKKRESSPSDRQNVREQDFYKDFVPGREASKDTFASHKEAMNHLSSKVKFRLVEFGNSMPDSERAAHLIASATAMSDLGGVLGLPDEKLSMNGSLAISFGARGSRGALATYIKRNGGKDKIMNLTRNGGYGALAHEWGHALSDSIGRHGHGIRGVTDPESLAPEFRSQQYLQDVRAAIADTGIRKRIRENDHFNKVMTYRAQSYWLEPEELYARFFEVYVERKLKANGIKNTYLTAGSRGYLWPTDEELDKVEQAFDKLIESIGGKPVKNIATKAG